MTDQFQKWDEMCHKIEDILSEYRETIMQRVESENACDEDHTPPDFDNIIVALTDWSLVFAIQDTSPDIDTRGYWTLHIEPRYQLPYRTRGLLESRLDML